ncbi:hypothetical protein A3C23_04780 [Candidatus Roizmanbacteria bacterium RIFCSPHIGHO2_02_FULL_37_13b]|uniref:Uncharacterized protein n=1 Tax=Candidatus Roizmanbacteria bacterium RIFCSPLOWO2_02_FULL_36_11 TaxID=1802071 RepID=A0A1F7JIF4_9BACT|nr:MAG: hypothetical protein A3C23_04780 [Candidatus Roizmanbacteria bacterium RIFCSPHIGHO2_02_FULL_37_13b]OGK55377.1 MAG: hypothetical protein A3H78_03685 [Candidatus Roizmanbacteria bacterium RIFCSPLOWO2_02_FULL_36_11]
MTPLLPEEKKQAYDQLTTAMVAALERGEMTSTEMSKSARYILTSINMLENHEELVLFLKDLMNHWAPYKKVFVDFKSVDVAKEDEEKLLEIQDKLKKLTAVK